MKLKSLIKNKLFISLLVLFLVTTIVSIAIIANKPASVSKTPPSLSKITAHKPENALKDIQVAEADRLYDLGDGEPVITAVISDKKPLLTKFPFLNRAYKNDLIITTPKKTVIYSPSTKSIRDISTVSMYDELSKLINSK